MARIAVQFVANSNMGAVTKDIARINAQLAALSAEMNKLGSTRAGRAGLNSMADTFRNDIASIKGYESATMSARTVTNKLTEDINRQKVQMKDLGKVRKNVGQLAQEQMRLMNSSAMITGRDMVTGRVMGELITPTNQFARSAKLASLEAGILGRALESAGIQATAAGKRMMWTGRQLSTGITAPIVAVAAVSAKAAYDIDAAMVRLTKVYGDLGGASEEELGAVRDATMDTARVVAREYGIAGKATVTLAADLAAAGYEGKELQETTREIQRIALLGELDQQKAMDATRTIQTVFGISTMDLANKFNFLNAVENQTNTTLQDLTEVIPRTAGVIREMGGTLEDSAVFTVAFKEAGIDAVQGANALRSSLGAIAAPSMVAQKKLQALGIDIRRIARENHPDNGGRGLVAMLQELGSELEGLTSLEKTEALAVLFGRYQFNKMGGLLKGLSENANDAGTQVGRAFQLTAASAEELAGVADREIKAIQESLSGRLRRAGAEIVLLFAEIGRPILTFIVNVVEGFAAILRVINGFPTAIKGTIGVMLGLLALAGPFLFFKGVFKALVGVTMQWFGANKAARAGVGELQTAQTTFAAHAANSVIPTIAAEANAAQKLGAAMAVAATQVRNLASAQTSLAGASAGTVAGAGRIAQQPRLAAGSKDAAGNATGGRVTTVVPPGATMLPIIPPGTASSASDTAKETDKAEKSANRLRGQWTGIAAGVALVGSLVASTFGGGSDFATGISTALTGIFLGLMLIPKAFQAVGKAMLVLATFLFRITGINKAFPLLVSGATKAKGAIVGLAGSMRTGAGAAGALRIGLSALMGPLGIVIAGLTAVVAGFMWYKKQVKEAKLETKALNSAGESLASFLGFEFQQAQAGGIAAVKEGTKSLHDQAKAWLETGEEAKRAAKAINEAKDIEKAAAMARKIGLDMLAAGVKPEEAYRIARTAMAAGGFSEKDILDALSIGDFQDKQEAIKGQLEETSKQFGIAMTEGFKRGARADQMLEDLGPKLALQLNNKTKPEIFEAISVLADEVSYKASEIFAGIRFEDVDLQILSDNDVDLGSLDDVRKFFDEELPRLQDAGKVDSQLPAGLLELAEAARLAADKEKILVESLKEARGYTASAYDAVDTLTEFRKLESGATMGTAQALDYYNTAVKDAEQENRAMGRSVVELTEKEKLALLNVARLAAGYPPATSLSQMFGDAQEEAAGKVDELSAAMEFGKQAATEYASSMRSALSSNVNDAISELMRQFDEQTESYKDGVREQNEIWNDGLEARKEASAAALEERERREDAALDKREKAMETDHDKRLKEAGEQKDARVKAIEDEMDKADRLDDQRKRMFDAEITRMQRLQAAANRNIDFNVALKTGNLDEAARIQESAYVEETTNQMNDAGTLMDEASEQRRAAGQAKITRVTTAEDARIARIQAVIDKEKESFALERQRSKDALNAAKKDAAERFEAEKESYDKAAAVAARSYEKARAERRRLTEEALKQQAIEIPRTEEGYKALMTRLGVTYKEQTGLAAEQTRKWNDLHQKGFITAMQNTHKELRNEQAWAQTGKQSVDAMTQGMLGMTFEEFATWMQTGTRPNPVQKALPPLPGGGTNPNKVQGVGGGMGGRHSGGIVDNTIGDRGGRPMNAPLYPDEVPTILQKGEYVLDRKTVGNLGLDNVKALHAARGQTSFFHEGGLVGATGMAIMDTFKKSMVTAIQTGANRKAQELAAAGQYEDIPEALQFVASAARAGKFGNTALNDEQLANAATIIGVGRSMGASDRDLIIALMTAMQESMLRNIGHGDRDSVGLFQQRTSQGWGSIEQIMDPKYSSKKFFEALLKIKGRGDMGLAQAAQAVQRSAFPEAYAKWEDEARAIMAATMSGAGSGLNAGQYSGGGIFRLGGGTVTGDIKGLNIEFLNRLARWAASVGQPYNVGSGYRSMEEQARLYNAYMAGVPGQAPAAPPGRSNHNYGLASDGPHWGGKNPGAFGLRYPMSYEPWHVEPVGAREMRIPQLRVGGTVNYDDTIANLHKNETVLTAPLSKKLEQGINGLDSGGTTMYNININGANQSADQIADKVMQKIQRKEQVRGPKRVIN